MSCAACAAPEARMSSLATVFAAGPCKPRAARQASLPALQVSAAPGWQQPPRCNRPHTYGHQRGVCAAHAAHAPSAARRALPAGSADRARPQAGSGQHLPAPARHVELRLAGRQLACFGCTARCQRQRAARRPAQAAEDGASGRRVRRLRYCNRRRRSSITSHGCLAAAEAPLRMRPRTTTNHAQPAQRHVHYAVPSYSALLTSHGPPGPPARQGPQSAREPGLITATRHKTAAARSRKPGQVYTARSRHNGSHTKDQWQQEVLQECIAHLCVRVAQRGLAFRPSVGLANAGARSA